ncbi:MAG: NHLP leader peptide family RiPP precursor [Tenacibaculum sp.]
MRIYSKAWQDSSFKKKLIDSPIETLNKFTGKTANLPKGKVVIVEDQTNPNHIYINIPTKPSLDNVELSEKQLEAVAGGGDLIEWWIENIGQPFV